MPLTPEQQELRYTKQRIIKALESEPYGYTTIAAVRRQAGRHADTWFDAALDALITDGLVARAGDAALELGPVYIRRQIERQRAEERRKREERKAARDAARAANTKKGARR
ncbi:hypothetical protein NLB33_35250 [Mycolicibacterium smegmatis]|uniref:hypothetical protein n=1 Tax=Mycolicibacterium smegmatis TaxID=1772 RepID=UPI0020A52002|nr:hypothetical protein [Mycolicibacterium smegmatis]MCP2628109.1 hypothetical protein [Mycolicibacterium smegmatis]